MKGERQKQETDQFLVWWGCAVHKHMKVPEGFFEMITDICHLTSAMLEFICHVSSGVLLGCPPSVSLFT